MRCSPGENLCEDFRIHVSATENDANSRAVVQFPFPDGGREGRCTGAFTRVMRTAKIHAHCLGNFVIVDGDHAFSSHAIDVQGLGDDGPHGHSIGEGMCAGRGFQVPARERLLRCRGFRRHNADHFRRHPQSVASCDDPTDSRAAADGHVNAVEVPGGFKKLQSVGGNAAYNGGMKSRYEEQVFFFRNIRRHSSRFIKIGTGLDKPCTEGLHREVFLSRIPARNNNRRGQASRSGGACLALTVIAARCRNDATALGMGLLQPCHKGDASANLEGARGRMVFMLHPDLSAQLLRERRPRILRRRAHLGVDKLARGFKLSSSAIASDRSGGGCCYFLACFLSLHSLEARSYGTRGILIARDTDHKRMPLFGKC